MPAIWLTRRCCAVCFAVSRARGDVDDVLVGLLVQCTSDTDPDRELAHTPASSGKTLLRRRPAYGGTELNTRFRCPSCCRGFVPQRGVRRPLSASNGCPSDGPNPGVRAQAAEALRALMNHRPEFAPDLRNRCSPTPMLICLAPDCGSAANFRLVRRPEMFALHLKRALDGPDAIAEQTGQVWAMGHLRGALPAPLPTRLADLLGLAARRVCRTRLAGYPLDELPALCELFDDDDPRSAQPRQTRCGPFPASRPRRPTPCCAASWTAGRMPSTSTSPYLHSLPVLRYSQMPRSQRASEPLPSRAPRSETSQLGTQLPPTISSRSCCGCTARAMPPQGCAA